MKNFAVQSRIVRTPKETPDTEFGVQGDSIDFVALHVIAKKQVEHTAIALVSVAVAIKGADVLATLAKRIIETKIK